MRIKEGFVVRKVADSYMAVPVGERTAEIQGVIGLNEAGVFLWKALEEEVSEDKLISLLMKEYEISEEVAKSDVEEFLSYLTEKGWLYE